MNLKEINEGYLGAFKVRKEREKQCDHNLKDKKIRRKV